MSRPSPFRFIHYDGPKKTSRKRGPGRKDDSQGKPGEGSAMFSLKLKPVGNRRTRPAWTMNDDQLMLRCIGQRHMLRFKIAQMYWRQNMSAGAIAATLKMSRNSVKSILSRLTKEPPKLQAG